MQRFSKDESHKSGIRDEQLFPVKERDVGEIPQELCKALKWWSIKENLQNPMTWRAFVDPLKVWIDGSDFGWVYHSSRGRIEVG